MIQVGIAGFGNVGRSIKKIITNIFDMELTAIVTKRPKQVAQEIKNSVPIFSFAVPKEKRIDVLILCGGSADLLEQGSFFASRFNVVCSFDNHQLIPEYFNKINRSAKSRKNSAIICAGWDPGLFSIMRVVFSTILNSNNVFTFWGEGVSQGHSNKARSVDGVLDARQYTIPIESIMKHIRTGKVQPLVPTQMHKRLVYVVAESGADKKRIKKEISSIPNYFENYLTEVIFISEEEMKKNHSTFPHGGTVIGCDNNQLMEFNLKLNSNPDFTASVLLACARAAVRLSGERKTGAFTMLDFPLSYLCSLDQKNILKKFI